MPAPKPLPNLYSFTRTVRDVETITIEARSLDEAVSKLLNNRGGQETESTPLDSGAWSCLHVEYPAESPGGHRTVGLDWREKDTSPKPSSPVAVNAVRITRCRDMLERYRDALGDEFCDLDTVVVDLLTDLRHLLAAEKIPWIPLETVSAMHYEEESQEG